VAATTAAEAVVDGSGDAVRLVSIRGSELLSDCGAVVLFLE
jgi:hypothetical protein